MNIVLLTGIIITGLSILCTVLSNFNPYRLNIQSFFIGLALILFGAFNATGIGIFLISIGLFSFVFSAIMYSKTIPGPWTFGFDFVTFVIWIEYLLNQLFVPVALVYLGIILL